jgi:hydroxylamine reductase
MSMFCFQCQEAQKGTGCTTNGMCGKPADLANMMDLLVHVLKGIACYSTALREQTGYADPATNKFVIDGLFATITNANFDKAIFYQKVTMALAVRDRLQAVAAKEGVVVDTSFDGTTWHGSVAEFEAKSEQVGILVEPNADLRSLQELAIYGVKGMAAYIEHAYNLGFEDPQLHAFIHKALAQLTQSLTLDELVELVLATGKHGVTAMAMLDKANNTSFGNPEVSKVNLGVRNNPGILISGHDLKDMEELLAQTEGTGVDVYTHSEMLPAHYYPAFKKYNQLVGNYGSSWWHQKEDFTTFNGPVLFTTNCIVPPSAGATYTERIYTTGASGLQGAKHIPDRVNGHPKDFSSIIAHAKNCQPPVEIETGEIIGGFAHAQVFALAEQVVAAVKSGAIRKFIVMAGCDGRMKSRDYYTEFATKLPQDTVILTAGCAKFRYNKLELGDIGGIPRVLDAGQCNDSYSLAVIALKLKEIFELNDINELPIAYNIAWYEQKAVIVLLALLHLGVKNIHLGPTLPAFLSPNVVNVLVENFGIAGITTVDEDIQLMAG